MAEKLAEIIISSGINGFPTTTEAGIYSLDVNMINKMRCLINRYNSSQESHRENIRVQIVNSIYQNIMDVSIKAHKRMGIVVKSLQNLGYGTK